VPGETGDPAGVTGFGVVGEPPHAAGDAHLF
jgi:hypothetical protein